MDSSTPLDDSLTLVTLPALAPPPGVKSNFINPVTRAPALIITCAVCITLMVICVTVRVYTKLCIKKTWGWDDWTCILATIGSIGYAANRLSMLGAGIGPHQWDVPVTAITPNLLLRFIVDDLIYPPTILMTKLSLLLLYLHIFRPNVIFKHCIYVSMGFLTLFYCGTFSSIAVLVIPKPQQSLLAASISADAAKSLPLILAQSAMSVATDVEIFCLPIPVVWKLQLPLRKRIWILAIFMTGLLACIASAFALYYRVQMIRTKDETWVAVFVYIGAIVELTVGVMCSCLISFPGFIRYHLPLLRSILPFFGSSFRAPHLFKQLNRSSHSGSTPGSISKSTKLGSRINGRGRSMIPGSIFATDADLLPLSNLTRNSTTYADSAKIATRREYYERLAEEQHSRVRRPPSLHDHHSQRSRIRDPSHAVIEVGLLERGGASRTKHDSDSGSAWRKIRRQPNPTRTGYWDVLSLFRSNATTLPGQSRTQPGGDDSAV